MINSLLLREVQNVLDRLHNLADSRDDSIIQAIRGDGHAPLG
jgi:hypothetical protein